MYVGTIEDAMKRAMTIPEYANRKNKAGEAK